MQDSLIWPSKSTNTIMMIKFSTLHCDKVYFQMPTLTYFLKSASVFLMKRWQSTPVLYSYVTKASQKTGDCDTMPGENNQQLCHNLHEQLYSPRVLLAKKSVCTTYCHGKEIGIRKTNKGALLALLQVEVRHIPWEYTIQKFDTEHVRKIQSHFGPCSGLPAWLQCILAGLKICQFMTCTL